MGQLGKVINKSATIALKTANRYANTGNFGQSRGTKPLGKGGILALRGG